MWYETKVIPLVINAARELLLHISHYGPEYWKALGCLIGYLKVKEIERIVFRMPKVLKSVIFFRF